VGSVPLGVERVIFSLFTVTEPPSSCTIVSRSTRKKSAKNPLKPAHTTYEALQLEWFHFDPKQLLFRHFLFHVPKVVPCREMTLESHIVDIGQT
jgi:hypothetical protein